MITLAGLPHPAFQAEEMVIRDQTREPFPEPCGDCGRDYLYGERVEWRVPTPFSNETRLAWSGCVDCFLRRTTQPREA